LTFDDNIYRWLAKRLQTQNIKRFLFEGDIVASLDRLKEKLFLGLGFNLSHLILKNVSSAPLIVMDT
jgi:hypothetical protein